MKVYVTRENLRLDCSLDDATLLDVVRLLNAKANLGSATTEIDLGSAGHKGNGIIVREGRPIDSQYIIKQNNQRVSLSYIIGACVRIPYRSKRLFLSCGNRDKRFLVLVHRPGYRYPYIPYEVHVACLDNKTFRIEKAFGWYTKIGDI